MKRDFGDRHMRERIAHLAARLMAEDGIEDYALAKRKAARQAGVVDHRHLPDNDQIDAELRVYQQLFQQEHPAQLLELRTLALRLMDELAEFDPHLTGSVLNGNANKYATLRLMLFVDSQKPVEHFLLNRNIRFGTAQMLIHAGDQAKQASVLTFEWEHIPVRLLLLSPQDKRLPLRTRPGGKALAKAKRNDVQLLLATK